MFKVINGTQSKLHAHLMPNAVAGALGQLGSYASAHAGSLVGIGAENLVRAHIKRLNLEIIQLRGGGNGAD